MSERIKTQFAYTADGIMVIDLFTGNEPQYYQTGVGIYDKVLKFLHDDEKLYEIITTPQEQVVKEEQEKFKAQATIDVEKCCAFVAGKKITSFLIDKWCEIKSEGGDISSFEKFIDNLSENPSSQSIEELIDFLAHKGFAFTQDGCFYGYKGVDREGWSIHGNKHTQVIQGKTNRSGNILNNVGDVIEVARNSCDDNRDRGCSHGLHVGTLSYAKSFGNNNTLLVKVNPKDVVSVPTDCKCQKLRCCKYEVIQKYDHSKAIKHHTAEAGISDIKATKDAKDPTSVILQVIHDNGNNVKVSDVVVKVFQEHQVAVNMLQVVSVAGNAGYTLSHDCSYIIEEDI